MIRIKGIQDHEAEPRVKRIFKQIQRRDGRLSLSARIRALDLELLNLSNKMNEHTARPGAVPANLKELAQLKVAAMVGCPF
jgi:hypothetical protein